MNLNELILQEQANRLGTNTIEFAIEKKYNGFRAVIHKLNDSVKIFSDQENDITFAFPSAVKQILELSADSLIFDSEMVLYENGAPLGRDILIKFVAAAENRKEIDDSKIIFHIFDCIYFNDENLINEPWHKRNIILKKILKNDKKNIVRVKPFIVANAHDAEQIIKVIAKLKGSEGAVVKRINGVYNPDGESDDWIKFRNELGIDAMVLKEFQIENSNAKNYLVGIQISEKEFGKIIGKKIFKIESNNYLILGKTFNTNIEAKIGEILNVNVEEIWRHLHENNLLSYSIHKPKVVSKLNLNQTISMEKLDELVVARGIEVKEY